MSLFFIVDSCGEIHATIEADTSKDAVKMFEPITGLEGKVHAIPVPEQKFVIKKVYDGGVEEMLDVGTSDNYLSVFAKVVSDATDEIFSPNEVRKGTIENDEESFEFRTWDYSYTMQLNP